MRRNYKKVVALGLTMSMGVTMLAGCGNGKEKGDKKDKVELVMSTWDDTLVPVIKQLSEAYNKEHPNVTVKPQLTTWSEYWTKLEASATGGSAPDIMEMNILHVEEYVEGGILMDLTEAEEKSDLEIHENFPEQLVNGYIIDDKLYGIPKDFDTNGVFYNKKIFDEAGVAYPEDNWTFEDFRKKCE